MPLLDNALKAAKVAGIPEESIFLLPMPNVPNDDRFATIDTLIHEGEGLPELQSAKWTKGQGARQAAFLCYSSGTSGLPV